ncbi:SO2930 family diheme c-type cytochrome [Maricaulis parjimensis]|uniref:SO2930 family diheme c-type cytochrome n=1 Tax=Maricaulis parjimensis TaxID=144023 RepID=UPI001EEE0D5F|nr:SO2930 family diheme c-type cytochrome [Maricaulis parjimensis]
MRFGLIALSLLLAACGGPRTATPSFIAEGNPPLLSDWGMMVSDGASLTLSEGVLPYDLNTPLFSDYAHKQRTIWMPEGVSAEYREGDVLDFPVGTVITKTFYYPRGETPGEVLQTTSRAPGWRPDGLDLADIHLVETRVLVHRETGWLALPYVWNDAQTDAELRRAGDLQHFTLVSEDGERQALPYAVPNANQCAGCHAINNTTRQIQPIGPAARHINRDYDYGTGTQNQLIALVNAGYLDGHPDLADTPQAAVYTDPDAPLNDRARSYLDINCAHCHNPVGPADTSGLHLNADAPEGPNLGLCKLPIAAGGGTGGRRFGIQPGHPEESILVYRLEINDPGSMMPELGRSVRHEEGIALITDWIARMETQCGSDG